MKEQVTSIEQSKRLIELGVPAEKASMVWDTKNGQNNTREKYGTVGSEILSATRKQLNWISSLAHNPNRKN